MSRYDADIHAIESWHVTEPPDPNANGTGIPYVCRDCPWTGRGGVKAFTHHRVHGHAVRGRDWPLDWPDAQFSTDRPVDRWLVGKEMR